MIGVDLSCAYLKETNLRDCNLTNANLSNANLYCANFRDANLDGANLSGADLQEAILIKANLNKADLSNADLRYANLHGANLKDTKRDGAKFVTSDISCPWDELDAEKFEELCYDVIEQKYNPQIIHKMGKANSRDGGRDLVFDIPVFDNKPFVKWIAQCKLIGNGSSFGLKKIDGFVETIEHYNVTNNVTGYCVMTSGVIDPTVHDRLNAIARKYNFEIKLFSKLELERFLAEYPEIRARYFKQL